MGGGGQIDLHFLSKPKPNLNTVVGMDTKITLYYTTLLPAILAKIPSPF